MADSQLSMMQVRRAFVVKVAGSNFPRELTCSLIFGSTRRAAVSRPGSSLSAQHPGGWALLQLKCQSSISPLNSNRAQVSVLRGCSELRRTTGCWFRPGHETAMTQEFGALARPFIRHMVYSWPRGMPWPESAVSG